MPIGTGGNYFLYLLFSLPALLLGMWAQFKVKNSFQKYSQVKTYTGLSGADIARRMLDSNGLNDVEVKATRGMLSDHYDPRTRTLNLSEGVYSVPSIAAAGVAAHEAGHAIQHATKYSPLVLRNLVVPTVQIGSWLGPIVFMVGLFMQGTLGTQIAWIGIALFALTAVFAIITLPVEFDASKRAKAWLSTSGIVMNQEMEGVHKVLDAAALTYVAGAVQAISTILYYAFLLLGRSRRD
ncbi:MAG TPA: zinc metallopeptidase [Bellilinea sp.]|nr:zinc metallopeptidase [Bellilinea sp.]